MAAIGTDMIPDIQILQKAIECGDVDKAKEIVSQLAALKTNLKIESKPIGDPPPDEIEYVLTSYDLHLVIYDDFAV